MLRLPKTLEKPFAGMTHAFSVLGFATTLANHQDLSTVFSSTAIRPIPYITTVPLLNNTSVVVEPPDRVTISLVQAIKNSDEHAFFHATNHAAHAYNFGVRLGLVPEEINELYYASLLHDIGKIFFTELVRLPRKLTNDEFSELQQHTIVSYIILSACEFSRVVSLCGLFHHLSYTQKCGYPLINSSLVETIPFIAKRMNFPVPSVSLKMLNEISKKEWRLINIVVLLDALDASIDPNRQYKSPLPLSQVKADFESSAHYGWDTMFNPSFKQEFDAYVEWLAQFVKED